MMMKPLRSAIIENVSLLWPSLMHFGLAPLALPLSGLLKSIKIYLPTKGILNIMDLRLNGVSKDLLSQGRYGLSSVYPNTLGAEALIAGRGVHTNEENIPSWFGYFKNPVFVSSIDIHNRVGAWAYRAYGLCIEVNLNGQDFLIDTCDVDYLLLKADLEYNLWRSMIDRFRRLEGFEVFRGELDGIERALSLFFVTFVSRIKIPAVASDLKCLRSEFVSAVVMFLRKVLKDELIAVDGKRRVFCEIKDLVGGLCLKSPFLQKVPPLFARVERELACFYFLAEYASECRLGQSSVGLGVVEEFGHFVENWRDLLGMEGLINDNISRLELEGVDLPVKFRAHGLSGSNIQVKKDIVLGFMKSIVAALADAGYECGICYGTFLGAVRQQEFIPYDDDVDMIVVLKESKGKDCREEMSGVLGAMEARGFVGKFCGEGDFLKITIPSMGGCIDIFPVSPGGESDVWMFMQDLKMRPVLRSIVLPLKEVVLYGGKFLAPFSPDGFLTDRYGASWQVEERFVGSRKIKE